MNIRYILNKLTLGYFFPLNKPRQVKNQKPLLASTNEGQIPPQTLLPSNLTIPGSEQSAKSFLGEERQSLPPTQQEGLKSIKQSIYSASIDFQRQNKDERRKKFFDEDGKILTEYKHHFQRVLRSFYLGEVNKAERHLIDNEYALNHLFLHEINEYFLDRYSNIVEISEIKEFLRNELSAISLQYEKFTLNNKLTDTYVNLLLKQLTE